MIRLKLSTASQEVPLGPFVDATDGFTLEDALGPIAAADIKLWKAGASALVNASGTATFMVDGTYVVVLDATDTNTVGPLTIIASPTGARPIRIHCEVLAAALYDSLFGTVGIKADLVALGGDAPAAARLTTFANAVAAAGVHTTGSTATSIVVNRFVSDANLCNVIDQLRGKCLRVTYNPTNNPNSMGQVARIVSNTAWSGAFPNEIATLTVEPPLTTIPASLDILAITDGPEPAITAASHVKASIEALQGSVQGANHLTRMGLASASGTLAAGSTATVLNISASVPTPLATNQLRGRVVLFVDESGSEAALKIQGGRIASNTASTITLESALTTAPGAGNVFIVV